jgi:hypothetical protein
VLDRAPFAVAGHWELLESLRSALTLRGPIV